MQNNTLQKYLSFFRKLVSDAVSCNQALWFCFDDSGKLFTLAYRLIKNILSLPKPFTVQQLCLWNSALAFFKRAVVLQKLFFFYFAEALQQISNVSLISFEIGFIIYVVVSYEVVLALYAFQSLVLAKHEIMFGLYFSGRRCLISLGPTRVLDCFFEKRDRVYKLIFSSCCFIEGLMLAKLKLFVVFELKGFSYFVVIASNINLKLLYQLSIFEGLLFASCLFIYQIENSSLDVLINKPGFH